RVARGVDVVDALQGRVALQRELIESLAMGARRNCSHLHERRRKYREGLERGVGARMLVTRERDRAVVVHDGEQSAIEPFALDRASGLLLTGERERVDVVT